MNSAKYEAATSLYPNANTRKPMIRLRISFLDAPAIKCAKSADPNTGVIAVGGSLASLSSHGRLWKS